MAKMIRLNKDKQTLIDNEDWELVKTYKWYYDHGYARSSSFGKKTYLHRLIMGASPLQVDHINNNPLDNRKQNLRHCTDLQNKQNTGKKRKNNKSGYKGVSWHKNHKLWRATIVLNKKQKCLGYYRDVVKAARAYDEAAMRHYKEFANINGVKE